jgi:tRNA A-37 threonylcarbamoyl transferase component Bud32
MHSLYEKLPKILPQSLCHGDFTLENLIYSKDNQFYMIDPSTGPHDSWIFDIAKMRQDFDGQWFIRNSNIDLSVQLKTLRDQLYTKFPEAFDDSLYILMLLRVYRHCKVDSLEHKLIIQEIKKIWN